MSVTLCLSEASHSGGSDRTGSDAERPKALIFDVDGTLYRQGPVRRAMLYRILRAHLWSPAQGLLTLRALRAYRKAQEELRKIPYGVGNIASAQLVLASKHTGICDEAIACDVARWMEKEPLPLLAGSRRMGLVELLERAKTSGLQLAAFSDYPPDKKLKAMGIEGFFDVVVSAQDPEVQRFKPDPRGLQIVLQRLKVRKNEAIYIGDRAAVDAAAATRAGIRHFILSRRETFAELTDLLVPRGVGGGCASGWGVVKRG
jgi:FMN phosphatase YigB (HAD superfamily)